MCIGIPAKIVSVDGYTAVAEVGGVSRTISVMLLDAVEPGQHVLLHAGYAISAIDEAEADEILGYLERIVDEVS